MIRIQRGNEPDALFRARQTRLAAARAAIEAGEPPVFHGYGVAREPLHAAQHGKCAYCEMVQQSAALTTEHHRPKAAVTADDDHVTTGSGYWWLAWTWNNLLFSCITCNSPARKGNHFALERGSVPLAPGQDAPGAEKPMFVDPTREDPLDHIVFVEERPKHWVPRARDGSYRGAYTIEKLGLDRPELLDLYRDHVARTVQPCLQELRASLKHEGSREVSRHWRRCLRRLFHPRVPFQALSYDVLHGSTTELRARWNLVLPRPPVT